ncbi:MAG TPA: translation initiation factor [Bacteroidetes bacterium]|nr:translation initiation factor [Bacteroidota bacterium]
MGKKSKKKFEIFSFDESEKDEKIFGNILNDKQALMVSLDKKNRNGKEVSLVSRYNGDENDLKVLCKTLKVRLGVGGSVKDGNIIIQGDHRKKIYEILLAHGFSKTKLR